MAFRAPNRGLAAMTAPATTAFYGTTGLAYPVWIYNGTRWYPDPTFPGQTVCPGNTVLWGGKLDYWLIGPPPDPGALTNAPQNTICRFDGVAQQWVPMRLPAGVGTMRAGACFSWDNCWFVGDPGTGSPWANVVHWDGLVLASSSIDATPLSGSITNSGSPWLKSNLKAAVARTDAGGNLIGFAVGSAGSHTQPDGNPAPELFGSAGDAFAPLTFQPPTFGTDLVAVDYDTSSGAGWVAGSNSVDQSAPILRFSSDGSAAACSGYDGATFGPASTETPAGMYTWTSLSIIPQTGRALAVGTFTPVGSSIGSGVIASVDCAQRPVLTRFPMASGSAVGWVSDFRAVAANATNDGWAAAAGTVVSAAASDASRPHLYRLTDGTSPLAPLGDDNEVHQLPSQSGPSTFQLPPTPTQPAATAPAIVLPAVGPPPTPTTLLATIYGVDPPIDGKVPAGCQDPPTKPAKRSGKSRATGRKAAMVRRKPVRPTCRHFLHLKFMVRKPLHVGIRGLHKGKVVAASGVKHFKGPGAELVMRVDIERWPDMIQWVLPKGQ
jgi:hypothetical protein